LENNFLETGNFKGRKVTGMKNERPESGSLELATEKWQKYTNRIHIALESAGSENIEDTIRLIFKSLLPWTWAIFCRECYSRVNDNFHKMQLISALVAVVNSKLPMVGKGFISYLIFKFKNSLSAHDDFHIRQSCLFLCEFYRQRVVGSPLIVQLIILLLSDRRYTSIVIDMMWNISPILSDDDKNATTIIFQEFFKFAFDPDISESVHKLTLWRQRNWTKERDGKKHRYHRLSQKFDLVEDGAQICHDDLDLEDFSSEIDPNIMFVAPYDVENFPAMRAEYKKFLSGLFDSEEEEQVECIKGDPLETISESSIQAKEAFQAADAKNVQLQIRRRAYLTIVSNVSANATAHALMKLADELQEDLQRLVITMCVDYTGMEKTFNRELGAVIETLCLAQPKFVEPVESSFVKNYSDCNKYAVHRVTNLASLYGYLLSKSDLGWHLMCVLRLTEEDTNSGQRVFIRFLMEELCHSLSLDGFARKLKESQISEYVRDLFPTDSLEHAEFASAFYKEIQLGFLCDSLDREIDRMLDVEEKKKQEELRMIAELQKKQRRWKTDL
jgi:pre-mRNA-splicing factor CWC22